MTREDTVAVRLKPEVAGTVSFSAGQRCDLKLQPGQAATTWANGDPIFRGQFQQSLEPSGLFELAPEKPAPTPRAKKEQ